MQHDHTCDIKAQTLADGKIRADVPETGDGALDIDIMIVPGDTSDMNKKIDLNHLNAPHHGKDDTVNGIGTCHSCSSIIVDHLQCVSVPNEPTANQGVHALIEVNVVPLVIKAEECGYVLSNTTDGDSIIMHKLSVVNGLSIHKTDDLSDTKLPCTAQLGVVSGVIAIGMAHDVVIGIIVGAMVCVVVCLVLEAMPGMSEQVTNEPKALDGKQSSSAKTVRGNVTFETLEPTMSDLVDIDVDTIMVKVVSKEKTDVIADILVRIVNVKIVHDEVKVIVQVAHGSLSAGKVLTDVVVSVA